MLYIQILLFSFNLKERKIKNRKHNEKFSEKKNETERFLYYMCCYFENIENNTIFILFFFLYFCIQVC